MQMQGKRLLAATQQQAWNALNDPTVLKACVPGCERFEPNGENGYTATTAIKLGPVSAKFTGNLHLSDIDAPYGYKLAFEGSGTGGAGFGKGLSVVKLTPQDGATLLEYTVDAQVGGKIAQLGQRLIDGVAKTMADDFFKRFEAKLLEMYPREITPDSIADHPESTSADWQIVVSSALRDLQAPPYTYLYATGMGAAVMLLILLIASR